MNRNWSPKNTNCVRQRGRGRERQQLGRETFIDHIIARAREYSGPRSMTRRDPSSQQPRIQHSLPPLGLSRDSVSKEYETEESLEKNMEHIEDQASILQPLIEYQLFGK